MTAQDSQRPGLILLVEDNPADVELLRMALDNAGLSYELMVVEDGAEALALFRQEGKYAGRRLPDLAVLDLNLPKHDAVELLAAARANRAFENLPVMVLSSSYSPRERSRLEAFRIIRYVTKPADLDEYMAIGRVVGEFLATATAASETA